MPAHHVGDGGPALRVPACGWLACPTLLSLACLLSFFSASLGFAAERLDEGGTETDAAEMISSETQKAIDRGLQFLARQQHDDGSFGGGGYSRNVAVCGLAGMAFMSGGSTPDRGPYGAEVARCVDFILKNSQESGFIDVPGSSSHGPMYGHGFATLFLAEAYGMSMTARGPRAAVQGRRADRQHAEQRGRLALSARAARRRHLGDDLRDHGPACGPQCRHLRAARNDRPLHRIRQEKPERRWRLLLHAARRAKRVSPLGRRRGGARTAPASTKGRRSRRACRI